MSAGPAVTSPSPPRNEVRTRLWMGLIMALAAAGTLVGDHLLHGWTGRPVHPFLLASILTLTVVGVRELHALLTPFPRPPVWVCLAGCVLIALTNWPVHLGWLAPPGQPWPWLVWMFTALTLAAFLHEMAVFRQPDGTLQRLSLFLFILAYLGLLPCYFVQLRWWPPVDDLAGLRGVAALALVIFVPKGADIGAFFTGRWLGRHRMTPLLSPKKTWEGLAGGLLLSALIAVLITRLLPPLLASDLEAAAFGIVVGGAGVFGDLAESLIKRECRQKDASHVVPGFGGILDVVDSVLFAAPVAYWWLRGGA